MSGTGDGRASWLTDDGTNTTRQTNRDQAAGYGAPVTGDPRAAFLGGHAGEVEQVPPQQKTAEGYVNAETMTGDPRRAAFAAGHNTANPGRDHEPVDTGIHGVGTGDPRAAWASNTAVDPLDAQEERDIRSAIAASLKDQTPNSTARGENAVSGDPRASWLQSDTAHGGRHNWQARSEAPAPGDIKGPSRLLKSSCRVYLQLKWP